MAVVTEFTIVRRNPIFDCGWEGGLRVERDTTGLGVGGNPANTVHTDMVWNRIGQGNKNREFSHMVLTENFSNEPGSEGCSSYLKTVKLGTAPIWGGCDEANDPSGLPGAMVAREFDIFAVGPATNPDDGDGTNGGRVRVGVDIVGGDEQFKRGGSASGAQGTAGVRVYATSTTPWFRWIFGGYFTDYQRTGLRLQGRGAERAIDIQGQHVVGLDFSRGDFQSVMRVREGQCYSFDGYDDFMARRQGSKIQFIRYTPAGHEAVFEFDMAANAMYIGGKRVLTE